MSENQILVALSTFCEHDQGPLEALKASGHPFRIHSTGKRITKEEIFSEGSEAAVIVAGVEPYDAATLAALPKLRCISRCGVGVDAIDLPAARSRGVAVVNTPDVPTAAVAELALSMFLSLGRDLRRQANLMGQRRWERVTSHLLGARTVGIVGFGRIGRQVARLCRAFGSRVIAFDPQADVAAAAASMEVDLCGFERLLVESDIVSLHASHKPGSPPMIGASELSRMKPGAILVNLARGGMVDEAALADALRSGHLAGAGLDVFAEEPYKGPLCDFEQAVLTPHSATLPVETRVAMEMECVRNGLRFLDGALPMSERVA